MNFCRLIVITFSLVWHHFKVDEGECLIGRCDENARCVLCAWSYTLCPVCPASRRLIGLAGVCQVALPYLPSALQQHHTQTQLDCDMSVGV